MEAYLEEQRAKKRILDRLLAEYDDGRKDVFFCLAVNMLEIEDLSAVLDLADRETDRMKMQEKAAFAEKQLRICAEKSGVPLLLRH